MNESKINESKIDVTFEHRLMRYLHGELEAAERSRIEARLAADPAARLALDRLRRGWERLEVAPPSPPPPDFAARVMAVARATRGEELGWRPAPAWVRAGGAAALVAGVVAGLGLGSALAPALAGGEVSGGEVAGGEVSGGKVAADDAVAAAWSDEPASLADGYWLGLSEDESAADGVAP